MAGPNNSYRGLHRPTILGLHDVGAEAYNDAHNNFFRDDA